MLHWLFKPSCPCDPSAKAWVEERLAWLTEEFEDSAFTGRPIVLPTPEFFPDPYDESEDAVRILFERVCDFMDVDSSLIDLKIVKKEPNLLFINEDGDYLPTTAGTYHEGERQFVIQLSKSQLHDPMSLVGTMAHELSHVRLLGESRVMREIFDNELLTDLTVVHFGLGIFLANTPRNWASQYSVWPGTELLKPEYMTPPMFGWAMAHVAHFRGEEQPRWAKHLKSDARTNFKQGLRYLQRSGDTTYRG